MKAISIGACVAILAIATTANAQSLPAGWIEVPGIGAKKYEHSGNATILAVEMSKKKMTLQSYFPVAQKQTAKSVSCPSLAKAVPVSIFDGQAMFASAKEHNGSCFLLVGVKGNKLYTKVAIERIGGETNVVGFAKQLLASDIGHAIAPLQPLIAAGPPPTGKAYMDIEGVEPGFPSNYVTTSNCVTFEDIAQFQTVYLAANIAPETRNMLTKKIEEIGAVRVVPNAQAAEFLVEVVTEENGTRLALWAVNQRPIKGKPGTRCNIMPNTKPMARQVVDDLGQYMAVMKSSRRGTTIISPYRMSPTGFPDYISGPYKDKMLCYKKIPNEEILQFKTIYIADNTPPDLRDMLTTAISATGKYTVVGDAMDANYLVTFDRSIQSDTTKYKDPDRYETVSDDPDGAAMGLPTNSSEVFIPGQVTYKTTRFEISNLSVYGVKHPQKPGEIGIVCGIFSKQASKIKGLAGLAMKNPSKKVTAALVKFLNDPDLSYGDYSPELLEILSQN